jgi:predicted MarR family transcription regulator
VLCAESLSRPFAHCSHFVKLKFTTLELRNKQLRATVAQLMNVSPEDYTSAQMSYDLRRLRLKCLIERVANTHQYRLTQLGAKASTFLTKLYERLFRPGLTASLSMSIMPSDLSQALEVVATIIDIQAQEALLMPSRAIS